MKTHVTPAFSPNQIQDAVEAALYLLGGGYPVALPTETVYGLAADATVPEAVLRIFQVKERPKFDPLIVHLPGMDWLDRVAAIPARDRPRVEKLAAQVWPGPLTLVLPKKASIPDVVTAGLETVAVRISAHPVFAAVIGAFGKPLAAPSANRFGRISPTTARHVMDELSGKIHLVVDAGPSTHGMESTIVTVRDDNAWILRNGPVTAADLGRYVAKVAVSTRSALPNAPGQLKSHYAPATKMQLLRPGERPPLNPAGRAGLLAWCAADDAKGFKKVEILSRTGDMREAAATLFSKLRVLDSANLDLIVAESVPEEGLGAAIMDRLRKAAGHG
ncbi:MAG: L-threonylcarbamoyladenylate synthase [Chthoniobacteraceae bacterium]